VADHVVAFARDRGELPIVNNERSRNPQDHCQT
jgi:hypothetical protein